VQPAQSASAGRISKRPFLIIGALLVIAAILALIFTNKIFISQQMLIGEWKSQDPNYLNIFSFQEDGSYVHSMYEQGELALKTIGRYEIKDKRINLCDAMNYFYHPRYKVRQSAGNNCSHGKPDGWIEITSMTNDTFYTTVRGAFVKIK
jgi:hypothetical protein